MRNAYINKIATAVPAHDIHAAFTTFAPYLLSEPRSQKLFERMAARSQIAHRYSMLVPQTSPLAVDAEGFYTRGAFPSTGTRMARYAKEALPLASIALDRLNLVQDAARITHLIITSCTGFYAPGLDLEIIAAYGLRDDVERSLIGFMGCYAAMNALKLARHIVRSEADACVLIVNLELCSLHLQETDQLESVLSFLLFGDGCAASIVSAHAEGIALQAFKTSVLPDTAPLITWHIGDAGFTMHLSGQVPSILERALPEMKHLQREAIKHWAVHPGGRTILDAVSTGLSLPPEALQHSRAVLHDYGNMSSATVMFVLQRMMDSGIAGSGCGLAFGPGLTAESLRFEIL